MSRRSNPRNGRRGPQLPVELQQKLGLPQQNRRPRTQVAERKQRRQDLRTGHTSNGNKRRKIVHQDLPDEDEQIFAEESDEGEVSLGMEAESDVDLREDLKDKSKSMNDQPAFRASHIENSHDASSSRSASPIYDLGEESDTLSRGSREYSPEVVLDANTKSFRDKQAEEDAEILALERRLGKKSKSVNRVTDEDFGDILTGLSGSGNTHNSKRQDQEWLKNKRNAKNLISQIEEGSSDEETDTDVQTDVHMESEPDDFAGFDDESSAAGSIDSEDSGDESTVSSHDKPSSITKPQRENPYIAPVTNGNNDATAKYVPPSRRSLPTTDAEKLGKLRRQVQGTLNKLSEANIISIVTEFEKLYQSNPRQDVTTVTLDLLLAAFTIPAALQNTFIILHAALLAALYKILGADFGAEAVSRLVESFDRYHVESQAQGKEAVNLISLLANLYTFGVISSGLVFDHVKLLLVDFTESNAELLLRVIRDCGPQLRSDDPGALKNIVQMMNEGSAKITSAGGLINIRTRVMMDTITDLKNNKVRQATNAAGATGEHLTRMRKALGSLNTRQLRATEPLGITRLDITNGDKKGKWWLVGASWKGPDSNTPSSIQKAKSSRSAVEVDAQASNDDDPDNVDYDALSRHYKFTTPTHRSIFTAILSATDATDALQRISKLRLTRKQEAEIPRVLLRVCRAEPTYNPYYAVLARLLLRDGKRYKFAFEVALWKFFEEIGEHSEEAAGQSDTEGRDGELVQAHEIVNIANFYAALVVRQVITMDILKTLNIAFLKENASLWLEMFFIALLGSQKLKRELLVETFASIRPDMVTTVAYFLRKQIRKSDLLSDNEEKRRVKKGVQMAEAALIASTRGEDDLE